MLHRVRKRKYTTSQLIHIPTEVDGEKYNVVTDGLSW